MTTRREVPERQAVCEEHGAYLSRRLFAQVWTQCPTCAGVALLNEDARRAEQAAEERKRAWTRKLRAAGIAPLLERQDFEAFQAETPAQRRALAFAHEYALDFERHRASGKGAVFVGTPGTGKTHLAAAIAMEVLRQGFSVQLTTVMRAILQVKDSWSPAAQMSQLQALERLTEPDLLVLDEVGVQAGSDFERDLLFDVMHQRYQWRRPTLLISNLPTENLRDLMGARVFDRLREFGAEYVAFEWESFRGRRG